MKEEKEDEIKAQFLGVEVDIDKCADESWQAVQRHASVSLCEMVVFLVDTMDG